MELYFFSVDKFSSSTPKDRQINTAPIVPSDDRVNRALKVNKGVLYIFLIVENCFTNSLCVRLQCGDYK